MSSPDKNPTHHFTSSAAAGGLQTTNLKTMPKSLDNSTETSSDPLEPHILEEEAFKAAYKAGNADYNDSAASKAQEKRSVKRKLKRAISNVKNKVGHEETSDKSSDEDYELDGTIKRTESGDHLRLVKTSSYKGNENEDSKKESNNDSLLKEKSNGKDSSESTNTSSTNPNEDNQTESPGDIEKDEIKTNESNSADSNNNKNDKSFDQKRHSSSESQKGNIIDREKKPAKLAKVDSKAKSADDNDNNNNTVDADSSDNSSHLAQNPDITAAAESPQTNSSKPNSPGDNHREEQLQKDISNSDSIKSSGNKNRIVEETPSSGTTAYETRVDSTSKDASGNSSTYDSENLGDITEGPSGTTYRNKSPGDIISLQSSSSEKLNADHKIGQMTGTSFPSSESPTTSTIGSKQKLNQKSSNVSDVEDSEVTSSLKINENDSSVINDSDSANKSNETASEVSDIHNNITESSLQPSSKEIDTTSTPVQPMKDDSSLQGDGLSNRNLQNTSSEFNYFNSPSNESKVAPDLLVSDSLPGNTDIKNDDADDSNHLDTSNDAGGSNHLDTASSGDFIAPNDASAFEKAPISESAAKTDGLTHQDGSSSFETFNLPGKKSKTGVVASHNKSGHSFTESEIRDKSKLPEQTSSHSRYSSHQQDSPGSTTEHPTELKTHLSSLNARDAKSNISSSFAGSNSSPKAEDIISEANENSKSFREKASGYVTPTAGTKVIHDERIDGEKASTHNKSFNSTSRGIPSNLETQIAKDPSPLDKFDFDLKPHDSQIAKIANLSLNEDQLEGITKPNNELSASPNAEEEKNYKVSSSSSQLRKSASTISDESQPSRRPIFEETKSELKEPIEYPFSNAQDTGIFDTSGNLPQTGAAKGVASLPIANEQGDQRVPRSGGISNSFDLGSNSARKRSQGSEVSTSSVASKNSFAMIAELQGLAQQSYNSHK